MITIDMNKLNPLEFQIHNKLIDSSKNIDNLKIAQAAEICGCSVSKISKFVKKLGFENYKQYINFLYGREIPQEKSSNELERVKNFIDNFDYSLVNEFIEMINTHDKIILLGYGPSFICTQYFEYKLRINTSKFVISVPDQISAERLIDENSLIVIFSTTGKFQPFDRIHKYAIEHNAKVLLIIEEYNPSILDDYEKIFMLTTSTQSDDFKPHEKSRVIFFIFIEEVIRQIIYNNRKKDDLE